MHRKSRKHLTSRLLRRTVFFFTSFSLGLVLLYISENTQVFLDSTQILILSWISVSALITGILSFTLIILNFLLQLLKIHRFRVGVLAIELFCLTSGFGLSIGAHILIRLTRGI